MGLQASHYARERLTWQASVHKLLACYDQVISGAKREESRDAN